MICSDGYLPCVQGRVQPRNVYRLELAEPNKAIRRLFAELIRSLYGVIARDKPKSGRIRAFGKAMSLDLQLYGPYGKLRWRAPVDFLNRGSARAWLRSYFDGDGDVRVSEKLSKCLVRARSVNRAGLIDVLGLLHSYFAIESKLYTHGKPKVPNWSQSYDLDVLGSRNIEKFAATIGFNHPGKAQKLSRLVSIIASRNVRS